MAEEALAAEIYIGKETAWQVAARFGIEMLIASILFTFIAVIALLLDLLMSTIARYFSEPLIFNLLRIPEIILAFLDLLLFVTYILCNFFRMARKMIWQK